MRSAVYGTKTDREELLRLLSALPEQCYRKIRVTVYSDHDSFIAGLRESPPDIVMVMMDGADGMEGVIAARNICGDVPVLWFSDDGGFGAQSYRLGCAYFHQKPVSPQILSAAIAKCG